MPSTFDEEGFWVQQWEQKLDTYLSAPPRAGLFVRARLATTLANSLELGAGSCRDSLYLAASGIPATASDFNRRTMDYMIRRFPASGVTFSVDDSRQLSFADGQFDLVFHNGLIVCFDDDKDVAQILREQLRVTRKHALILVHNGENPRLMAEFARLGVNDPLYRIRFYTRASIRAVIDSAGLRYRTISFHKFGGPADFFYGKRLVGMPNPLRGIAQSFVTSLYPLQPWSRAERIAIWLEV